MAWKVSYGVVFQWFGKCLKGWSSDGLEGVSMVGFPWLGRCLLRHFPVVWKGWLSLVWKGWLSTLKVVFPWLGRCLRRHLPMAWKVSRMVVFPWLGRCLKGGLPMAWKVSIPVVHIRRFPVVWKVYYEMLSNGLEGVLYRCSLRCCVFTTGK